MDPRDVPNYGDAAELPLPPLNTCEKLVSGLLVDSSGVEVSVKASGLVQYRIPDAEVKVGYPRGYDELDPGQVCGAKWAA
jgi:hypothetical protein